MGQELPPAPRSYPDAYERHDLWKRLKRLERLVYDLALGGLRYPSEEVAKDMMDLLDEIKLEEWAEED